MINVTYFKHEKNYNYSAVQLDLKVAFYIKAYDGLVLGEF